LRSEALRAEGEPAAQLGRVVSRCNDLLAASNEAQQFVTCFCALVDARRGRLYFVNAGHHAPLVKRSGEAPRFLEQPRNPIAGLVPDLAFRVGEIEFPASSVLLLYTDGVTEAEAADGTVFGEQRLFASLLRDDCPNARALVKRVVAEVDEFSAGQPQSDDITLLALRSL
jgi:sigma-B regulation protein RsbU (phosphoserine phosphatase)